MRIGVQRGSVRALLVVAFPFAASGLLAFAITNADQIVVGRLLHAADLGYFVLALCLASWPVTVLSQPVRDAAPVAFAHVSDAARRSSGRRSCPRRICWPR